MLDRQMQAGKSMAMKRSRVLLPIIFLFAAMLGAAQQAPAPAAQKSGAATAVAQNPAGENDLQTVLAKMNQRAGAFRSAQADFEFETYHKVVDEKELQKGHIYFYRTGKNVDAALKISTPATKVVVYKDGKIRIYEPRIDQLTERDVGKNKADVEAFLSLGFGARGDDLEKSYDVTMAGWESVDGTRTAKLDLTPKEAKLRNTYDKIILWIDLDRDVLLKQQFIEKSGDYRLARYMNMKLNGKISDDVFRIKTTGSTKLVKPQ
jgi:outer membrane lipoprotein-sorting protein